ncbi:chromaffin granule amine transporter-like [Tubulanus polymorphus]|uniref:chromaffin granule amine transporter-like n=1 Tax=Tubulanus polymorphus TaxID=672921 RepID=UPI003DA65B4E
MTEVLNKFAGVWMMQNGRNSAEDLKLPLVTPSGDETANGSRVTRFLSSTALVKVIAFNSVFLGALVTSVVIPILPALLVDFEKQAALASGVNSTTGRVAEFEYNGQYHPCAHRNGKTVEKISFIFLAKPFSEMLTNLITGRVVDSFGFRIPLLLGSALSIASVIGFTYVDTILLMTLMRIIEGVGTSLSVVSSLALVTSVFKMDDERTKAISIGYMGWSAGVALGYPFGAVTYYFFGRDVPFLMLGALSIIDGILRLVVRPPVKKPVAASTKSAMESKQNLTELIRNSHVILIVILCFAMYTICGAYLTLAPDWMLHDLCATMWQVGVILLIGAVFQTAMKYFVGWYGIRVGRWVCAVAGYLILVVGLSTYTLPPYIWALLGPDLAIRIGYAANACSLTSLLALVCERNFPSQQGSAFGIYNAFTNLGFVVGPLINIGLLQVVTTTWCLRMFAGMSLLSACLAVFLKFAEDGNNDSDVEELVEPE